MLGVEPIAGREELRRAYVARAMAFHPDRVPPGDEAATANAEHRMTELNAAWEVLRDDDRRAEYDREVLGLGRERATARGGEPASEWTPTAAIGDRIDEQRSGGPWWWLGPALVLALILVGAAVVAVLQAAQQPDPEVELRTGELFEPGMCIAVRPGPIVEEVPCGAAATGRIVEVRPFPRPCADGMLEAIVLPAEALTLCVEPLA